MTEKRWRIREADPGLIRQLQETLGVPAALATVLAARGIRDRRAGERFLDPRLANLGSPAIMADMATAVQRLGQAVLGAEPIGLFGDYDVDGISATALVGDYLRRCGARVALRVARRQEGYGFGVEQAEEMASGDCRLLILLDCGTSDHEAVALATRRGIDVVALDHHQVSGRSWPGLALVNPQRPDCPYPFKGLATVGISFCLVALVRRFLQQQGRSVPDPRQALDLVALGTIADVAPLCGENRILVARGLAQLGQTERPGLRELLRLCNLEGRTPRTDDVGWILGPRLNAPGRLGDPEVSLDCLWQVDPAQGAKSARQCHLINDQRKELQAGILEQALAQGRVQVEEGRAFVLVASDGWHQGIIGIVASRLVEELGRPAAVVSLMGEEGRGSARGLPGLDLVALLRASSEQLERFGGHEGAAGFSVKSQALQALGHRLHEVTAPLLSDLGPRTLEIDGRLDPDLIDLQLCEQLERLAPFGQGNPEPLFMAPHLEVLSARSVGNGHLRLQLRSARRVQEGIGFGMESLMPRPGQRLDVAFVPEINTYMGPRVQLKLADLRPSTGAESPAGS